LDWCPSLRFMASIVLAIISCRTAKSAIGLLIASK
jgi:hypothetical protein